MATVPPFLKAILKEANLIAPFRHRASDGLVGDAAHQARASDHNPDLHGIIHAVDITHDPDRGFDSYHYAEVVRAKCETGRETRIKYVVSHDPVRRTDIIASPSSRWKWRTKTGRAHANHVHISILSGPTIENSTSPLFGLTVTTPPAPTTAPAPMWRADWENDMPKPSDVTDVLVTDWGEYQLKADGSIESDDPMWGSYFSIAPEGRQGERYFVAITGRRGGMQGYTIWGNDRTAYTFGPDIKY